MAGAVLALEKAHDDDDDDDDDNSKSESKFPIESVFKVFEKQNLIPKNFLWVKVLPPSRIKGWIVLHF